MKNGVINHPSPVKDVENAPNIGCGRKKHTDAKGVICIRCTGCTNEPSKLSPFSIQQKLSLLGAH